MFQAQLESIKKTLLFLCSVFSGWVLLARKARKTGITNFPRSRTEKNPIWRQNSKDIFVSRSNGFFQLISTVWNRAPLRARFSIQITTFSIIVSSDSNTTSENQAEHMIFKVSQVITLIKYSVSWLGKYFARPTKKRNRVCYRYWYGSGDRRR